MWPNNREARERGLKKRASGFGGVSPREARHYGGKFKDLLKKKQRGSKRKKISLRSRVSSVLDEHREESLLTTGCKRPQCETDRDSKSQKVRKMARVGCRDVLGGTPKETTMRGARFSGKPAKLLERNR